MPSQLDSQPDLHQQYNPLQQHPQQQQGQQQPIRPLQPLRSNSASTPTEPARQAPPPAPEPEEAPSVQPRAPRRAAQRRVGGPSPRSLRQLLKAAHRRVVQRELDVYLPIATGFQQIDRLIGGGLRLTELVLLGGAQGIGKTITALQMARDLALYEDTFAFYISYEHSEVHLLNRLICQ